MTASTTIPQHKVPPKASARSFVLVSACYGLVTGVVEGMGLLTFHGFRWFNTRIPEGVSVEILWISPLVDLFLFLALGLSLAALSRFFPRLPTMRIALTMFPFLAVADWVGLTGRISTLGVLALAAGVGVVISRWMYERSVAVFQWSPKVLTLAAAGTLATILVSEGGIVLQERFASSLLPAAAKSLPNLLIIVVDTLRADHLSTYGYTRPTSPHLDVIARQGVLFEDAISTSSWTLPAHQSLLTGRYPHEHGTLREQTLNASYPTLAQVLDGRGYRTAAFSANTDFFCRRAGFGRGFLRFEDYFYSVGDMLYRTFWGRLFFRSYVAGLLGVDELPARRKASDVNRSALHWIDQDRQKPFFVFLNYFDIHSPYVPDRSYRFKFAANDERIRCAPTVPELLNPLHRLTEFAQMLRLSPACFQLQIDAYDGGISYIDDQISDLFAELARRGLAEDTIVVITSDHGESFREHGLVTHGTSLYRELIRVPLLYWWPGHIPAGMRISRPVTTASLPGTILELLGDENSKQFPVPSLAVLWKQRGTIPGWPSPLSEMAQDLYIPERYPAHKGWLKCITDERWHLIVSQSDQAELYEYSEDPGELHNLAKSAEGRQVISAFGAQLWKQVTPENRNTTGSTAPPDEDRFAKVNK